MRVHILKRPAQGKIRRTADNYTCISSEPWAILSLWLSSLDPLTLRLEINCRLRCGGGKKHRIWIKSCSVELVKYSPNLLWQNMFNHSDRFLSYSIQPTGLNFALPQVVGQFSRILSVTSIVCRQIQQFMSEYGQIGSKELLSDRLLRCRKLMAPFLSLLLLFLSRQAPFQFGRSLQYPLACSQLEITC